MKKKITLVLLLLLILLSCRNRNPYTLGFMATLSGGNSDLGEGGRNGFLLAVEEKNKSGGINGRQINVIIKDGEMIGEVMVSHMAEFKKEKAEAIVGPFISAQVLSILPAAEFHKLLVFSPTASSMDLVDKDDMLFRCNSSTRDNTTSYADYLVNRAGLMSVGLIYDRQNLSFSESWKNEFSQAYTKLGGEILYSSGVNSKLDSNFQSNLEELLATESDCVLLICNSIDSTNIIQRLRLMDKDIPVVVSEWAGTSQFIELGGRSADGVVVLQSFNLFDQSPGFQEFLKNFKDRFKIDPSYSSVMAYDTTNIIIEALEGQKPDESLKEALLRLSPYEGVQERIAFNQYGDTQREAIFSVIQDGQFRKLE